MWLFQGCSERDGREPQGSGHSGSFPSRLLRVWPAPPSPPPAPPPAVPSLPPRPPPGSVPAAPREPRGPRCSSPLSSHGPPEGPRAVVQGQPSPRPGVRGPHRACGAGSFLRAVARGAATRGRAEGAGCPGWRPVPRAQGPGGAPHTLAGRAPSLAWEGPPQRVTSGSEVTRQGAGTRPPQSHGRPCGPPRSARGEAACPCRRLGGGWHPWLPARTAPSPLLAPGARGPVTVRMNNWGPATRSASSWAAKQDSSEAGRLVAPRAQGPGGKCPTTPCRPPAGLQAWPAWWRSGRHAGPGGCSPHSLWPTPRPCTAVGQLRQVRCAAARPCASTGAAVRGVAGRTAGSRAPEGALAPRGHS